MRRNSIIFLMAVIVGLNGTIIENSQESSKTDEDVIECDESLLLSSSSSNNNNNEEDCFVNSNTIKMKYNCKKHLKNDDTNKNKHHKSTKILKEKIILPKASTNSEDNHICTGKTFKYQNLVLEGGGLKLISYVGALKALKESAYYTNNKYTFKNIAGSSAGCLMGFLISLDLDPAIIEDLFESYETHMPEIFEDLSEIYSEYKSMLQASLLGTVKSSYYIITMIMKLLKSWSIRNGPGLTDHTYLLQWLSQVVIPKSSYGHIINNQTTFRELYELTKHNLSCIAANLGSNNQLIIYNEFATPSESVFRAIYASTSVPFLFKPLTADTSKDSGAGGNTNEITQNSKNANYDSSVLVDGGLFDNFPIYIFDHVKFRCAKTLGLSLHSDPSQEDATAHVVPDDPSKTYQYAHISNLQMINMMYSALLTKEYINYSKDVRNKDRIIYLNSPLSSFDLSQSLNLRAKAISRAYANTLNFFHKKKIQT